VGLRVACRRDTEQHRQVPARKDACDARSKTESSYLEHGQALKSPKGGVVGNTKKSTTKKYRHKSRLSKVLDWL
jgi:hypothetical protein